MGTLVVYVVMVTVVAGISLATVIAVFFFIYFIQCLQNLPLLDFDHRSRQKQSLAVSEDFGASAAGVPAAPVPMATVSMAPEKSYTSNAFASSCGFDLEEMFEELMINFPSSTGAPLPSPSWNTASDVNYGLVSSTPKSLVKAPEPLATSFGSAAATPAPRSTNPFLTDITSHMNQQSSSSSLSSQNPFLAPKSSFSLPNGRSGAAAGVVYPPTDWLNQPLTTRSGGAAAALPPLVDTATVSGVARSDSCRMFSLVPH